MSIFYRIWKECRRIGLEPSIRIYQLGKGQWGLYLYEPLRPGMTRQEMVNAADFIGHRQFLLDRLKDIPSNSYRDNPQRDEIFARAMKEKPPPDRKRTCFKEWLDNSGHSIYSFARMAGVHLNSMYRFMRGKRISLDTAKRISLATGSEVGIMDVMEPKFTPIKIRETRGRPPRDRKEEQRKDTEGSE